MQKIIIFITFLTFAGCSSYQSNSSRSQLAEKEFELLTKKLNDLNETINTSESTISLVALRNDGQIKELAEFPATYELITEVVNNRSEIDVQNNNKSVAKISLPTGYEQIRIKKSPTQMEDVDFSPSDQSWLMQKVMNKVKDIYDSYQNNPFIIVTGFSLELGISPSISIDFKFKQ